MVDIWLLRPESGDLRSISTVTPRSGAVMAGIAPSAWRGLSGLAVRLANLQDNLQLPDADKTSLG